MQTRAALPADFEWVWYWGDGSPEEIVYPTDAFTSHQFAKPDKYIVTLRLRTQGAKSILGTSSRDIVIDDINVLQQMKTLRIVLTGTSWRDINRINDHVDKDGVQLWPLKWQGNSASARWQETLTGGVTRNYSLEALIADDELTVLKASWSVDTFERGAAGNIHSVHEKLTVKNVPLSSRSMLTFYGKVESSHVRNNVLYEYESTSERFLGFTWDDPRKTPRIECEFKQIN